KGEGVVTAAAITHGSAVEVLNPEQHISTLSKDAHLEMDLVIRSGRGYVTAFSPIRKVNYAVTNARVGQRTDYDRLTLEVWTDGSVRPEDAMAYAARILQDQLSIFINF